MRKIALLFIISLLFIQAGISKESDPILVGTYNLRYENSVDGMNSWSYRKEHVKALIKFHEFDIFGTEEGLLSQLNGIAELPEYAFTGKGRDDGKDAGEHSAIFYRKERFKLLDSGDFWLSETPDKPTKGWDAQCCKRIFMGQVQRFKYKKGILFLLCSF
jgi:hypothetical protein